MRGLALRSGPSPRRLALVVLLAVAALTLVFAIGSPGRSAGDKAKPKVVGKVVSVTGNVAGLTVKPEGGRERVLETGDLLHLGDVIDPDQGVQATIRLEIPAGVDGDPDLVRINPDEGDAHTVRLERTGKGATTVTISD